jgi:hypothetical protein
MAKVFEVDFKGSLKDRISGTIPTNTNVIIRQQEKGRCAHFAENGYLSWVDGDLSSDQGSTVDVASAFSFAKNVLTIQMTAGQKLRGFTITSGT